MVDAIIELVEGALGSPWGLLALFALAAVDGFFPVVPSESLVITAGVLAVTGRTAGDRLGRRAAAGSRRRAALEWAGRALATRGGSIIVVCRYIPGARTAVTLTAGAVRYPLRSFSFFDGVAALSWATYAALVGFLGGTAFEDEPIKGVVLGLGVAVSVAGLVELVRHARSRRRAPAGRIPA